MFSMALSHCLVSLLLRQITLITDILVKQNRRFPEVAQQTENRGHFVLVHMHTMY